MPENIDQTRYVVQLKHEKKFIVPSKLPEFRHEGLWDPHPFHSVFVLQPWEQPVTKILSTPRIFFEWTSIYELVAQNTQFKKQYNCNWKQSFRYKKTSLYNQLQNCRQIMSLYPNMHTCILLNNTELKLEELV